MLPNVLIGHASVDGPALQRSGAVGVMRLPISCFVIARNEADRIVATIRAVREWVDEIVVIDSGSTDGTDAFARREGAPPMLMSTLWLTRLGSAPARRSRRDLCAS